MTAGAGALAAEETLSCDFPILLHLLYEGTVEGKGWRLVVCLLLSKELGLKVMGGICLLHNGLPIKLK